MPITREDIERRLRLSISAVEQALITLYRMQTDDEKTNNVTIHKNHVGFNAFDAEFGSNLARQIRSGRPLTGAQIQSARRLVLKYAQQLTDIENARAQNAAIQQTITR